MDSSQIIRNPAVSGAFYSADADQLREDVRGYLSRQAQESIKKPKFLIVPHAGYIYSGEVAAAAYIEVAGFTYDQIFLIGPSHHYSFKGAVLDKADYWETPLGRVKVAGIKGGINLAQKQSYHLAEHSLEVQVPFLQELLPGTPITPILLSGGMGQSKDIVKELERLEGDFLFVISTDFNHVGPRFGYEPESHGWGTGTELDQKACTIIESGDTSAFRSFNQQFQCTICGNLPILTAMLLSKRWGLGNFKLKAYDHSASKTGGPDSVGYAALYL